MIKKCVLLNFHIISILVCLSILLAGGISSQARIISVGIIPQSPTSADSVVIFAEGFFFDGCWSLDTFEIEMEGNSFYFNLYGVDVWQPGGLCIQVIVPYTAQECVRPLDTGTYIVNFIEYHDSQRDPYPEYRSLQFNVTSSTNVSVEESQELIPEVCLFQNYPNPSNSKTEIHYFLPHIRRVKLSIYNLLGQKIKTLVDGYQTAGYKRIAWNGKDDHGEEVGSGIYFYKIKVGEFAQTKKMVILK